MKRIAVTGAGGFVGSALIEALRRSGYYVVALGRHPDRFDFPNDVERRFFDADGEPDKNAFEGTDAVIHLAGESVAGRWTDAKKRAIFDSRVLGTRNAIASCALCETRPSTFICASATGFYGSRTDEPLDENSSNGSDFLAGVCAAWEREARGATAIGMRSVQVRTGIALGHGGALEPMARPFRYGLGGPFGSGRQFLPWIHLDDLVRLYLFVLERDEIEGAINAVTPDYATSARFSQALGAALHRPAVLPAPALALHLALGEFSETILASQLVLPARAMDAGFTWHHPNLENALAGIFQRASRSPLLNYFESDHVVRAPLDRVFAFFSDAANLESITPPSLRFAIAALPSHLSRGAQISYSLHLHGVRFSWKTMIARWQPPHGFDDVQLHGPYALWHHEHRFESVEAGTRVRDRVTYALPLQPFGNAALPLVKSDVEKIFAFRQNAIERSLHAPA